MRFLCVFSSSFYCELLPLLCVIFPIHTQAISMSHSKCSVLRSRPKVFLQTDFLFMVFSSINGLLSPDIAGISVGRVLILTLNRNAAINIIVWRHSSSKMVFLLSYSPGTGNTYSMHRASLQFTGSSVSVVQNLTSEGNIILFTFTAFI